MAKRKAKQAAQGSATDAPQPMSNPSARFEMPDGLPDGLPNPGKPIRLVVEGTLQGVGLKEFPEDRDNIHVRISKVTVSKGRKSATPAVDADETTRDLTEEV